VGQDKTARDEMIALTDQRSVPVIVIDGQVIIGFDQSKIEAALNIKQDA
jgi:glutaredoxin